MAISQQSPVTETFWIESRRKFDEWLPQGKREPFRDVSTLQQTISELQNTQSLIAKQYATHTINVGFGKTVKIKVGCILQRLNLLLKIGDTFMEAAPESVSLVWAAFRMMFKGFVKDVDTCKFFVDAVDDITDMLFMSEIFAKRYSTSGLNGGTADVVVKKVREQITTLFTSILKFSYHVRRLFNHGKIVRTLAEIFKGQSKDVSDALEEAQKNKEQLAELAGIAYQEAATEVFKNLQLNTHVVDELFATVNDFVAISAERELRRKIKNDASEQLQWLQPEKSANLATPGKQHEKNIRAHHEGTCTWILKTPEYEAWRTPNRANVLWLSGGAGFGKSVLVSHIIEELATEKNDENSGIDDPIMLYFFCKLGDDATQQGNRVVLHLLAQLIQFLIDAAAETLFDSESSKEDKKALEILNRCAMLVGQSRSKLRDSQSKDSSLVQIRPVLQPLLEDLVTILERELYIIVDALDECVDRKDGILATLLGLGSGKVPIHVLVSSRPEDDIVAVFQKVPNVKVDKSRTEADIRSYVVGSLRMREFADWNKDKHIRARDAIVKRAEGVFRYANIVVESMKLPEARQVKFTTLMNDLPVGLDQLYKKSISSLREHDRNVLLTALRWLICGVGEIDALWIADELEPVYEEEDDMNAFPDDQSEEPGREKFLNFATHDKDQDFESDNESHKSSGNNMESKIVWHDGERGRLRESNQAEENDLRRDEGFVESLGLSSATAQEKTDTEWGFHDPNHRTSIEALKVVGRDFLKFDSRMVSLQHNSIRDFVLKEADAAEIRAGKQRARLTCQECINRSLSNSTYKAAKKQGHLLMIKNILKKINSPAFQQRHILQYPKARIDLGMIGRSITASSNITPQENLIGPLETRPDPVDDSTQDGGAYSEEQEPEAVFGWKACSEDVQVERRDELARRSDVSESSSQEIDQPEIDGMRYEFLNWGYHFREAEKAWPEEERNTEEWNQLYDAAEQFLDIKSEAFRAWMFMAASTRNMNHGSPFLIASGFGLTGLMKRYLEQKEEQFDINQKDEDGDTPLSAACMGLGDFVGLEILVDAGADVNARAKGRTSCLQTLVEANAPPEHVTYLMAKGADPALADITGRTCLHFAAAQGNKELCQLLLQDPAVAVNAVDNNGETPLHWVCKWPNASPALIKLLIQNGADVNAQDKESQAPLYEACIVGNLEGARVLLDSGADIDDVEDERGFTPVHAAVKTGNLALVRMLIDRGADLSIHDRIGRDVVMRAAITGNEEVMAILLGALEKRNNTMSYLLRFNNDDDNGTALYYSLTLGHLNVASMLLQAGPALEMCTQKHFADVTLLHILSAEGYTESVKLLLDYGSVADMKDLVDATPIDYAMRGWAGVGMDHSKNRDYEGTICLLVKAQPNAVRNPNLLKLATEKNAHELCKLLNAESSQNEARD